MGYFSLEPCRVAYCVPGVIKKHFEPFEDIKCITGPLEAIQLLGYTEH